MKRKYKRKAAAKVFFHLFAVLSNAAFQMSFNHLEWGEDVFTPVEKAHLDKMKARIAMDAEYLRRFAQRLNS